MPLTTLDETPELDMTVDGADEIGPDLTLIKGGGGALLREKIVAAASARMVVIADESKWVKTLGRFPLPIEVMPFGLAATRRAVEAAAAAAGCPGPRRPGAHVDDDAFLALEHEGGAVSHLWMSAVAAAPGPRFRVLGSHAAYVKQGLDGQGTRCALAATRARPTGARSRGRLRARFWPATRAAPRIVAGDYPRFYALLRDALTGAAPLPVDPSDAVAVLALLEAAAAPRPSRSRSARGHLLVGLERQHVPEAGHLDELARGGQHLLQLGRDRRHERSRSPTRTSVGGVTLAIATGRVGRASPRRRRGRRSGSPSPAARRRRPGPGWRRDSAPCSGPAEHQQRRGVGSGVVTRAPRPDPRVQVEALGRADNERLAHQVAHAGARQGDRGRAALDLAR